MAAPSSDEDELGAYNSSPYRQVELAAGASSKPKMPNGRGVAVSAPSNKPEGSRQPARRANAEPITVDENSDRGGYAEGGETDTGVPAQKKGRQAKRAVSREPEASQPVRKARMNRAKGKEKARPESVRETSAEVMEIDGADETDYVQELPPPALNLRKQNLHGPVTVMRRRDERERKKLERLEKQLEDVKKQRDSLAIQLEEVFHARNTELEERIETLTSVYESRIQTQEESIKEMTSQLARVDSLTREGKTTTLHILTREAADEERRELDRELERLKAALNEKDRIISERDATVRERDQEIRTLGAELTAEIERSKTLASARPGGREPSSSKARPLAGPTSGKIDNVKSSNILRLYEDMSNILFIDCKCEVSEDSVDEQWVYNCLYKHVNSKQSLSFILRTYLDDDGGESVEKVAYTPTLVENDSPELLERLDFLRDEFTFTRQQLDIFLNKLYNAMTEDNE